MILSTFAGITCQLLLEYVPGHTTAPLFFKESRANQFKKLWRRAGKVFSVQ